MLCVILSKGAQPGFLRARHGVGTKAAKMLPDPASLPATRRKSDHQNAAKCASS